jgi:hypothetical protein
MKKEKKKKGNKVRETLRVNNNTTATTTNEALGGINKEREGRRRPRFVHGGKRKRKEKYR